MIKDKLGAGSFGEVYKVESKEDNEIYAVKRSSQKFRGEWDRLVGLLPTLTLSGCKHPIMSINLLLKQCTSLIEHVQ